MEPDQRFAAVGTFILLGILGIGFALFWLSGSLDTRGRSCYVMRFDNSVAGLSQGSSITFRGVEVGKVERIRINPNRDTQILVRALLDERTPIHTNTVATLKPQGITGASYIELDVQPGLKVLSNQPTRFDDCRSIATLPSNIDKIVNTLPRILDQVLQITAKINGVLDPSNTANLSASLANLNGLTQQLNQQSAQLGPQVQDAVGALKASLDNINALTATLEKNSSGNLQDVQQAVRQTTLAAEAIRDLADQLRANPRRLLTGPKVPEEKIP